VLARSRTLRAGSADAADCTAASLTAAARGALPAGRSGRRDGLSIEQRDVAIDLKSALPKTADRENEQTAAGDWRQRGHLFVGAGRKKRLSGETFRMRRLDRRQCNIARSRWFCALLCAVCGNGDPRDPLSMLYDRGDALSVKLANGCTLLRAYLASITGGIENAFMKPDRER
jgi:hypothetical protein